MVAIILNPVKISLAQFHIDEKDTLQLSFLVHTKEVNEKILMSLKEKFPTPIEVRLERKTDTQSLLQILGDSLLFKVEEE